MSASVRWTGLDELRAALRQLPEELEGEGDIIVEEAANYAAAGITQEYERHKRSGNLIRGLRVTHNTKPRFGAVAVLKSTSQHAWLFDNGSQARHYVTKRGKRHNTGEMWGRTPPTHTLVRNAIKARRRMNGQLRQLVERHGFVVSGDV